MTIASDRMPNLFVTSLTSLRRAASCLSAGKLNPSLSIGWLGACRTTDALFQSEGKATLLHDDVFRRGFPSISNKKDPKVRLRIEIPLL